MARKQQQASDDAPDLIEHEDEDVPDEETRRRWANVVVPLDGNPAWRDLARRIDKNRTFQRWIESLARPPIE